MQHYGRIYISDRLVEPDHLTFCGARDGYMMGQVYPVVQPLFPPLPCHLRVAIHHCHITGPQSTTSGRNIRAPGQEYAPEEKRFVRRLRDDLGMKWDLVVTTFNLSFRGPPRTKSGLQSLYFQLVQEERAASKLEPEAEGPIGRHN